MADKIEIIGAWQNPNRRYINIDGDGSASFYFDTDATQLVPLLTAFAKFKGEAIKIILTIHKATENGKKRTRKKTFVG